MATKIELGLSTYLINFAGGQTPYRSGTNYVQYATDHDTNYVTLRNTINQVIDELNAVQGPNAGLGVDVLVFDDPERLDSGDPNDAAGLNNNGFVGLASFEVVRTTTSTANDSVLVDPGLALIGGVAVRNTAGATKVGSGGAGTRYIAIDMNGAIYLETTAGVRDLDLWTVTWDGAAFTDSFVRQQQLFFDGDEYEAMRARPAAGTTPATFPARRYEAFHYRMEAVERLLAGFTTDSLGNALGQMAIPAGSAGTPGLAVNGDPNTGIYQGASADELNFSAGGNQKFRINSTEIEAFVDFHAFSGGESHPGYTFSSDHDTGMWLAGANRLAFSTAAVTRAEFDAEGNLDLPTNSRVKGVRTATLSLVNATPTNIPFTATDDFDVGSWHNEGGGSPGDEQFTVPTGATGLYDLKLWVELDASASAADLLLEITIGGTPIREKLEHRIQATPALFCFELVTMRQLTAGDVVRARITQTQTTGTAAFDLQTASFSIVKVA